MRRTKLLALSGLGLGLVVGPTMLHTGHDEAKNNAPRQTVGNASVVKNKYNKWKAEYEKNGGDKKLAIGLGYDKALSAAHSSAQGKLVLDITSGGVNVEVEGLAASKDYDVWLVDNIPGDGKSSRPEAGDKMVRIGTLQHGNEVSQLETQLDSNVLAGGDLDLVVVAEADKDAVAGGVLFGSPQLFQRLYYSEKRGDVSRLVPSQDTTAAEPSMMAASFAFLVPGVAHANDSAALGTDAVIKSLVEIGEDLFFNETFAGNGRTCGTCHPAENNFTIDPLWISRLPNNDPLFVNETNPALAELENSALLRQLGLILENKDGFNAAPVFRSPVHMLGLSVTVEAERLFGTKENPADPFPFVQGVGWDGSGGGPGNTIRGFGSGAVAQHFPKTLNRIAGVDFRVPTETELDAMEAFMFSLGRDFEYNLQTLRFSSPIVEFGKQLFDSRDAPARCKRCHDNGGANSSTTGQNGQRNTGVEDLPNQLNHLLAGVVGLDLHCDGGFGNGDGSKTRVDEKQGLLIDNCGKFCNGDVRCDGCGDGTFNITTVIEAADTPPFFHNNSATTIEEAIEFYNSDAFNNSPAAIGQGGTGTIHMETSEVAAIALFLRTINAFENIRIARDYNFRSIFAATTVERNRLISLAILELEDAIEVLEGAQIITNPESIESIRNSIELLKITLENGTFKSFDRGVSEDADFEMQCAQEALAIEEV